MELAAIDWVIIAIYFVITIGVGLAFAGRAGKSLSDFFVSGRSLPWWIAGTSMVATTFAADTPLAVTGLVAKHGLAGNWLWWSFALGGMLTVFVYSKLWRRAKVMTDVEFIELRYGGKPAAALRGIRAGYFALIVNPIIIGWVTKAMIDFLHYTVFFDQTTGQVESSVFQDWSIILVLFLVVGVYCSLSGMWGVAITDVIQFCLAMFGCIWLAVLAVNYVGGIDGLQAKVAENYSEFSANEAFEFFPNFAAANPWMPITSFLIMIGLQWWATWYPGAEPGGGGYVVQRMASCKDERHALKATLWYQIAHYCLRPWPWIMVAFVALALYPNLRDMDNPNVGFPMVIRDVAPFGLRGLLLVTFFAAFMSTISTQMNWGASLVVRDIYQRFLNRKATEKQLTRASRWASVLILALGVLTAYVMNVQKVSIDDAWNLLLALGAGSGLVYMLRWFWWRINAWSEISAMVASLCFFLMYSGSSELNEQELILVVAVPTILTWLTVTYLTKPESTKKLEAFYRLARPGGPGWKPIAAQCRDVKPDEDFGLSIVGAFIASGVVYCLLFAVGKFIFRDYFSGSIALILAAVSGLVTLLIVHRLGSENPDSR